jgi:5-methylcytosine-specific restriction endonuclease McrA
MSGPTNLNKVDRLRARDGDDCWLCGKPINFDARPNSGLAPTREHLLAQTFGGPDKLENLVLCHAICNRRLASLPIKEKVDRREKRLRKQWVASARAKLQKIAL